MEVKQVVNGTKYVTGSMQTSGYWIERMKQPDNLVMTEKSIERMNQDMLSRLTQNEQVGIYDLMSFSDSIEREALEEFVQKEKVPEGDCYLEGKLVTEDYWEKLKKARNLEMVQKENPVKYGVVVKRGNVRLFPTDDIVSDSRDDICFDLVQGTAAIVNEPLVVLFESEDKEYYFIVKYDWAGWLKKEYIALCENKKAWMHVLEMDSFLLVTGDRMILEVNPYDAIISKFETTMGTKLALAGSSEIPFSIGDRALYDNFIVKVPYRAEGGMLDFKYAMVPLNRDVWVGYLPYTRANVLKLAFKMLGNIYGWGGMLASRDCSSLTQEIYRCFGFQFPRNADPQSFICCKSIDLTGLSDDRKKEVLNQLEPGALLQMPEHIMIYLGSEKGHYFVIDANGGFVPSGSWEGTRRIRTRSVTVNDLEVRGSTGNTWLQSLRVAKIIEPEG